MSQILVTGAKGLIGAWTVKKLLSEGYSVIGVDLSRPKNDQIPDGMKFIEADISDFGETHQVFNQTDPDIIVHLAAVRRDGIQPNFKTFQNNVMCAYNVFDAAAQIDTDVIWTSSIEIHGSPYRNLEESTVPFETDLPVNPPNAYALSKQVGESLADFYADKYNISVATIRPAWINEPGNYKTRSVRDWYSPEEVETSNRINTYYWSYIDVRDVARLLSLLIETEVEGHERFFAVADDTYVDIKTAKLLSTVFDFDVSNNLITEYNSVYSTKKAKKFVGWEPAYSWRDEETVSDITNPVYRQ